MEGSNCSELPPGAQDALSDDIQSLWHCCWIKYSLSRRASWITLTRLCRQTVRPAAESMLPTRYIHASEINTYLFCKRAWHLSRCGETSALEQVRAEGVAFHRKHGEQVRSARNADSRATCFALAGIVLLSLFLWLVLR